jgi:hypothetical protein
LEVIEVKLDLPISFEVRTKAKVPYPIYLNLSGKRAREGKAVEIANELKIPSKFVETNCSGVGMIKLLKIILCY